VSAIHDVFASTSLSMPIGGIRERRASMSSTRRALASAVALAVCTAGIAQALEIEQKPALLQQQPLPARRNVDLVIALDVSDSMSGLIDST
jgi:hypothetical protein